jgi:hypothetical protein
MLVFIFKCSFFNGNLFTNVTPYVRNLPTYINLFAAKVDLVNLLKYRLFWISEFISCLFLLVLKRNITKVKISVIMFFFLSLCSGVQKNLLLKFSTCVTKNSTFYYSIAVLSILHQLVSTPALCFLPPQPNKIFPTPHPPPVFVFIHTSVCFVQFFCWAHTLGEKKKTKFVGREIKYCQWIFFLSFLMILENSLFMCLGDDGEMIP